MQDKVKNLLFIIPDFPSVSETFILNQMCSLIDLGYDVEIFSTGSQTEVIHKKILDYSLISKTIYPQFPSFGKRIANLVSDLFKSPNKRAILTSINPFKFGISAFKLTVFCKIRPFLNQTKNYDAVHIHFGQSLQNFLVLKDTGLITTENVVLTFHGYDLNPTDIKKNRKKYRRILEDNIKITVNTPYLASVLKDTLANVRPFILPVGLDTLYFQPSKRKSENGIINIIFCGRFIKLKGIERLPQIIQLVTEKMANVKFHIVGSGDRDLEENFIQTMIYKNINKYVTHYGSLSQEKIVDLYMMADIFILPGIYDNERAETQGLVIQEAQSMQIPVVVTDAGGMKYGVDNGKTGFVVDYKSNKEFAEKILYLAENRDQRIEMGKQARQFAVAHYDNKVLAKKLVEIYKFQ